VGNLNQMTGAIGRHESSLASAIGQLPDFMRQFNTTAVNLRAALDDVDPLVTASRPVAKKLKPFVRRLRGFAFDAVPTVKGLNRIVRRAGPANDLIELTELQNPLAEIGVGPVNRNGQSRQGALPESAQALTDSLHQLAFFRPYTPELVGWFDDFAESGAWDANGSWARQLIKVNAFTISQETGLPTGFIPFADRGTAFKALADTGNLKRCPGANERDRDGSIPFRPSPPADPYQPAGGLDCDPTELPTGN
jgi:phospholipid/cholesterol/gamma-HCH transport system substrate-binding protein